MWCVRASLVTQCHARSITSRVDCAAPERLADPLNTVVLAFCDLFDQVCINQVFKVTTAAEAIAVKLADNSQREREQLPAPSAAAAASIAAAAAAAAQDKATAAAAVSAVKSEGPPEGTFTLHDLNAYVDKDRLTQDGVKVASIITASTLKLMIQSFQTLLYQWTFLDINQAPIANV